MKIFLKRQTKQALYSLVLDSKRGLAFRAVWQPISKKAMSYSAGIKSVERKVSPGVFFKFLLGFKRNFYRNLKRNVAIKNKAS